MANLRSLAEKFQGFLKSLDWPRIVSVLVVLVLIVFGWLWLSGVAKKARTAGAPSVADYNQAKFWMEGLLGLATTLTGLFGVAKANFTSSSVDERSGEVNIIAILAGATLLGLGGWGAPVALAAAVTGSATVRVVRAVRFSGRPESKTDP